MQLIDFSFWIDQFTGGIILLQKSFSFFFFLFSFSLSFSHSKLPNQRPFNSLFSPLLQTPSGCTAIVFFFFFFFFFFILSLFLHGHPRLTSKINILVIRAAHVVARSIPCTAEQLYRALLSPTSHHCWIRMPSVEWSNANFSLLWPSFGEILMLISSSQLSLQDSILIFRRKCPDCRHTFPWKNNKLC